MVQKYEEQLQQERDKSKLLEEENKKLKDDGKEQKKKIKELTSRLDFLRKQKVNFSGPDSNLMTGTSMADISILEQLNGNSRIGGYTPDNFSGDNVLAMEEKDDQIEALKSQIELLESQQAA